MGRTPYFKQRFLVNECVAFESLLFGRDVARQSHNLTFKICKMRVSCVDSEGEAGKIEVILGARPEAQQESEL